MQLRTNSAVRRGWFQVAAVLVIAVAALTTAASAVHAQVVTTSSTVAAVRVGGYAPMNSNTIKSYGRYLLVGGLDYDFQTSEDTSRSLVSVDYLQVSQNNNNIRIIPLTIGQQQLENTRGRGVIPYTSYGIGAYIVHLKNANDLDFGPGHTINSTEFGGYIGAGLQFTKNVFVDARYHIMTPTKSVNTDALEVTGGIRF